METKVKNLISKRENDEVSIYPENSKNVFLPYFRKEIDFTSSRDTNEIIKSCETLIRNDEAYDSYKAHLINNVQGMNKCALFSNIDIEMAKLEMHHGPIFNLYDYVEITIVYLLKNNKQLSTFKVADIVLEEHRNNLIQVVMLSEMAHKAVHPKKPGIKPEFISIDAAFGDLVGYISKYKDYISYKHLIKIKKYLNEYEKRNSDDLDTLLVLRESIKSFKNPLENIEGDAYGV